MRKAVNDNPMVQIGVLAVLALVVGFVLITQVGKGGSSSSSDTSTSAAAVPPGTATTSADSTATATTPSDSTSTTPSATAPNTGTVAAAPPVAAAGGVATGSSAGKFVAGSGLPAAVVKAYEANEVVVLLVVRRDGIDDDAVKASVERMAGLPKMALFVTNAGHVSRYSRIAAGVNLDRVPALIVLRPDGLTNGGAPQALVSYGFRSPGSVAQAIRDALYAGRTDLPYYPR
jgi:hypothetical protein